MKITKRQLRRIIKETLLREDPMGFVQDLSAAHQAGEFGENFMGGDVGKSGGKALKRSFADNADHQWLSTLDTVHWTGGVEYLPALVGRGKDELSTSMTLPGENFAPPHKMGSRGVKTGLWVKGRITLAANDQDNMYTGDFVWRGMHGQMSDLSPEEQEQREKSSGINKLPSVSKDYSRYGQLKKGTEFGEKMARNIPYVLDQSTWDPSKQHSETNEALVDNWRPVGIIVVEEDVLNSLVIFGDTPSESIGVVKELFRTATEFGVPIYDVDRNEVWKPGEKEVKEESVREYIRRVLTESPESEKLKQLLDTGDPAHIRQAVHLADTLGIPLPIEPGSVDGWWQPIGADDPDRKQMTRMEINSARDILDEWLKEVYKVPPGVIDKYVKTMVTNPAIAGDIVREDIMKQAEQDGDVQDLLGKWELHGWTWTGFDNLWVHELFYTTFPNLTWHP